VNYTKFGLSTLRKSLTLLTPDIILRLNWTKFDFGWALSRPRWANLQLSPDLAGFQGSTLKGDEGKEGQRGQGGEGTLYVPQP